MSLLAGMENCMVTGGDIPNSSSKSSSESSNVGFRCVRGVLRSFPIGDGEKIWDVISGAGGEERASTSS